MTSSYEALATVAIAKRGMRSGEIAGGYERGEGQIQLANVNVQRLRWIRARDKARIILQGTRTRRSTTLQRRKGIGDLDAKQTESEKQNMYRQKMWIAVVESQSGWYMS